MINSWNRISYGNFRCENIFVVCVLYHKIYFTTDDRYSQQILFVHTLSQHSYFARDGFFLNTRRWLMANAWQLSAQCPINRLSLLPQYVPIAFFGSLSYASSLPTAAYSSHERWMLCSTFVSVTFIAYALIRRSTSFKFYRRMFMRATDEKLKIACVSGDRISTQL